MRRRRRWLAHLVQQYAERGWLAAAGQRRHQPGNQHWHRNQHNRSQHPDPRRRCNRSPLELPAHIKPVNYKLWFRPNADLTGFSGRADVEIKVTKQTGEITLAARNLRFDPARVTLTATGSNTTQMLVPVPQSQGDFYDLRLPTGDIKPGTYMLHMEWTGTVNFTKAEGLFKLGLQGATGEKSDALITQGAANLSRQWFPCWDEPAFRHTFELTAEVPGDWKAIANGKQNSATQLPDGYQRVAFAKTPSMPSYLMFFGGGKFDVLEDQFTSPLDTSSTLPLRWWCRPAKPIRPSPACSTPRRR